MNDKKESPFHIVVIQNKHSKLWYWRVYGAMEQPVIASNGYAEEEACRANLDHVRQAFVKEGL